MDARMKTADAINSCSPPASPWVAWLTGNAGDKIQISSGTVAMRLSVMEFGRFMGLRYESAARLPHGVLRGFRRLGQVRRRAGNAKSRTRADSSILPYPRGEPM